MSPAAPAASAAKCPVCQNPLQPNGTCPRCQAPEDWSDHLEAVEFVMRRFRDWHQQGQLTDKQLNGLIVHYEKRREDMQSASANKQPFVTDPNFPPRDECWSCEHYLYKSSSHCHECGAPLADAGVKSLRYWRFLLKEIGKQEDAGLLTLRQAHTCSAETEERIAALQRKLERDRALMVIPVTEEPRPPRRKRKEAMEAPAEPVTPRRTFLEVILDPNSIQWLLGAGGALIVLGLVIWLISTDFFKEPIRVAVALGVANVAILGAGWWLMLGTRFHHAGRALTLLACLVMPLNLWFYHSYKILTLEDRLWIAGLVCCGIYTASAFVLKDHVFVYVLVAGITLTGLLMLAQEREHIEQVFYPTVLLISIGFICLHLERAFPPGEGPFSRERFGMAFYWSSQPLFAAGLLLLMGAQFVGWLHEPIFKPIFRVQNMPDVATRPFLPFTLILVLAGTYAYIYSDLVVRRIGVYLYLAAITLLWAEIHVLVLTGLTDTGAIVIITLALTGLAVNVIQAMLQEQQPFIRRMFPLGLLLSVPPVLFGVLLHFRAVNGILNQNWLMVIQGDAGPELVRFKLEWSHVLAMAITAACCRAGAYIHRNSYKEVTGFYFLATAAATLVFAAELLWMVEIKRWELEAVFLMVIPILYLIAAKLYQGHTPEQPLVWCAHLATGVMIFCSIWAALEITPQVVDPVQGQNLNLLLSLFCLECAFFYGLAGFLHRSQANLYMAAVMLCGAIWQLLQFFHTPQEIYVVAFAITGFVLLMLYRIGIFESLESPMIDRGVFQSANALATLGFVSGALMAFARGMMTQADLARLDNPLNPQNGVWQNPIHTMIYLLLFLCVIGIASALLVHHPTWRRVHIVLTIANAVLIGVMIHKISVLNAWQKMEIFSIVLGLALLIFAYIGWYRETERASDVVSIAFLFGSLALVAPMLIAIIAYRIQHDYRPGWDDLGLVVACVLLFGSGVMCRIKATTIVGSGGMFIFILIVIVGLHRHLENAQIIGIYLAVGGAVLFGTGLFLSMYRDRLLALPEKIRKREGLFRIFDWR